MNDEPGLRASVQRYFDLCYDNDTTRFERVFYPSAQLHGLIDGKMTMLTADGFRALMAKRPSVQSTGAAREDAILLIDFASPAQALVKVRVRWDRSVYVDDLIYHRIDGEWLITAKGFHIERTVA